MRDLAQSKKARMAAGSLTAIPLIVGMFTLILNSQGVDPETVEAVAKTLTWAHQFVNGFSRPRLVAPGPVRGCPAHPRPRTRCSRSSRR